MSIYYSYYSKLTPSLLITTCYPNKKQQNQNSVDKTNIQAAQSLLLYHPILPDFLLLLDYQLIQGRQKMLILYVKLEFRRRQNMMVHHWVLWCGQLEGIWSGSPQFSAQADERVR